MLRAFSTAATGMTAQQTSVDVTANNLANINTTGFKRSQLDIQDLIYVKIREAGQEVDSGVMSPTGFEIGNGVRAASTLKVFTQGEMENTGRPLDLAIERDGFFQVTLADGSTAYTRDGSLRIDANGTLVTSNGYTLTDSISIPTDFKTVSIGRDGTVSVTTDSGVTTAGNITLARFANPSGLSSLGGNLLAETAASGTATTGAPGQSGLGSLQQGFLERSNVQMVKELVSLITAQRAYEVNSRAIKAGDEMLTTANRLIGG